MVKTSNVLLTTGEVLDLSDPFWIYSSLIEHVQKKLASFLGKVIKKVDEIIRKQPREKVIWNRQPASSLGKKSPFSRAEFYMGLWNEGL